MTNNITTNARSFFLFSLSLVKKKTVAESVEARGILTTGRVGWNCVQPRPSDGEDQPTLTRDIPPPWRRPARSPDDEVRFETFGLYQR